MHQACLVADAMTDQDACRAVNSAKASNKALGLGGASFAKLDGDAYSGSILHAQPRDKGSQLKSLAPFEGMCWLKCLGWAQHLKYCLKRRSNFVMAN